MKRLYYTLCLLLALTGTTTLFSQTDCLVISAAHAAGSPGDTVCIDVTINNFTNIGGMQWSMRWDDDVLFFAEVKNLNLYELKASNFGYPSTHGIPDQLTFFWFDPATQGVSMNDGETLFTLCFEVIGSQGDYSPITFDYQPTDVELGQINGPGAFDLTPGVLYGGSITVGGSPADVPIIYSETCPVTETCTEVPPVGVETSVTGGTAPYAYSWTGKDNFAATTPNLSEINPGAHLLKVTDASGYSNTALFYATGSPGLQLTNQVVTPIADCNNEGTGAVSYEVSGGSGSYDFQWSDGATTQNRSGLSPGSYQLTVTDQLLGCALTQVFNVNANNSIIIKNVKVKNASCGTDDTGSISIELEGPTEGASISWSDGATGLTNDQLAPGIYHVSVIDAAGCLIKHTEEVKESTAIEFSGTTGYEDCGNASGFINLDVPGNQADLSFAWNNGATTKDISGLAFGVYRVTVTNSAAGCEGVKSFIVNNKDPLIGHSYECTVIDEETVFAKVSTIVWDGGTPPYTFNWSNGESMTDTLVGTTTVSVPTTLSLTITDANGCTYITPTILPDCEIGETPVEDLSVATQYQCLDDQPGMAEISATVWNGGVAPYTFTWSNGQEFTSHQKSSIIASATGNYTVTITDQLGNSHVSNQIRPVCNLEGDPLTLTLGIDQASAGEAVCLPIAVEGFNDILGLQFTLSWDPTQLRGDTLINHALANFGKDYAFNPIGFPGNGTGIMTFAWTTGTGLGQTLPDHLIAMEVCFTALGDNEQVEVIVSNQPTLIEAVNIDGEVPVIINNGLVTLLDNTEKTVWPGDTDQNGLVDHFDLLNIGLAYGAEGLARPEKDLKWEAHFAAPWPQSTPNTQVNYRHIDTDGNGTINANDTLALALNYKWFNEQWNGEDGYHKRENLPTAARTAGTPLYVDTYPVAQGTTSSFDIMLGDDANTDNTVYGLGFSINYDPLAIVPGSIRLSFEDSWLGDLEEDLLTFYRDDPENHMVHVAMTRTDGEDIRGAGPIAQLLITIEDVIFRSNDIEVPISIENARLINFIEEAVPVETKISTITVSTTTNTLEESLDRQIRVYPVPTKGHLYLKTPNLSLKGIELFSLDGRRLQSWQGQTNELSLQNVPQGTYSLRLITEQGVAVRRIVVLDGER